MEQAADRERVLTELWRDAAERGPACLAVAGTPPRVVWANHRAAELLGESVTQLTGPSGVLALPEDADGDPAPERDRALLPGAVPTWRQAVSRLLAAGGGRLPVDGATPAEALAGPRDAEPRGDGGATAPALTVSVRRAGAAVPGEPSAGWLVEVEPFGATDDLADTVDAAQRFQAIAVHGPIGLFASEAGLRVGYVNDRFAGLCRRERDQLLGTGWLDAFHPQDRDRLDVAVQQVLHGRPETLELRLDRGLDPEPCWVELRLAPTVNRERVAGFVGIADDITERRRWGHRVSYLAAHDPATGLANREALTVGVQAMLCDPREGARAVAVIAIGLGRLQQLGADEVEAVMVEVAQRIRGAARAQDMVARTGSGEFAIALTDARRPEQVISAAERHLGVLGQPFRLSGRAVELQVAVGVATSLPEDDATSLLHAALAAVREQLDRGRAGIRVAGARERVSVR